MTAVLNDFLVLMAVRAVVGLAAGVCTVCGTAIIADAVAPQERGGALYTLALGASVALIVGIPASRLITAFFDWRTDLWRRRGSAPRTLPSTAARPAAPLRKQLSCLANHQVLAVMTSCVAMFISYSMIFTYVAPYLASVSNSLKAAIGWVLMGMGIASLVGSKLEGCLVGRVGAMRTLVMGTALHALILGLAFLFPKSDVPTGRSFTRLGLCGSRGRRARDHCRGHRNRSAVQQLLQRTSYRNLRCPPGCCRTGRVSVSLPSLRRRDACRSSQGVPPVTPRRSQQAGERRLGPRRVPAVIPPATALIPRMEMPTARIRLTSSAAPRPYGLSNPIRSNWHSGASASIRRSRMREASRASSAASRSGCV